MPKMSSANTKKHPNVQGRIQPHSNEAEQALLGSILLDENAALRVLDGIDEQDFYSSSHRSIFVAMQKLAVVDKPIDLVTLSQQLDTDGTLEKVGGVLYLSSLTSIVPSSDNFNHYKNIVTKNGLLRQLIAASSRISKQCYAKDATDDILQVAEQEIFGLSQKRDKRSFLPIGKAVFDAIQQIELVQSDPSALRGIPTPFAGLNKKLGGLQRSDLILIAARPGQGKTSIGMNIVSHVALANVKKSSSGKTERYKCAVFSLEMPAMQLAKRMLCSVANVNMQTANTGKFDSSEWNDILLAKSKLDGAHIYIDDNSLTTPTEILSKCRRLKREQGLDLVMIDYLQLMSSGKRVENRQQEVSEITRMLKIAAKELDVPILLLSQMSREVEKRVDKRPQMSDLRESGAIEQDADIIIFIYRKYDINDMTVDENTKSMVELHIAKHRNGETGIVELKWDGKTVSFKDLNTNKFLESLVSPKSNNAIPIQKSGKASVKKGGSESIQSIDTVLQSLVPPQEELTEQELLEVQQKIRDEY